MVSRTKSKRAGAGKKARMVRRRVRPASDNEGKLLQLITDPCGAELVHGYALSSEGVVQRFNRFITPVATTETGFAYIWQPGNHAGTAVAQKVAVGTGTPTTVLSDGPGETFLDSNADSIACLAGCIQVLYTGKLVDRKGYIGVCQVSGIVAADIAGGTTDLPTLLSYCQHVAPVPSQAVELKWSPSIRNFTAQNATPEFSQNTGDNALMVVAIGVNPNDFVVKFTGVYEYVPKFALGLPAPRATRSIPPAAGERIVSALDRMGVWWHNLGNAAAAAYRMGGAAVYGIGQAARTANAARQLAAAVPLLALAG